MNYRDQNEKLAKIFDEMARDPNKNTYQKKSYKTASDSIRRYDKLITSGSQAQKEIKGVGKSIADKIDEVLETGKLNYLEQRDPEIKQKQQITTQFEKIHGVGPKTAEKWYDEGYRGLESLKDKYNTMTDQQKLGYYYYNQLNTRIPRSEIDEFDKLLKQIWEPYEFKFEIGGSYRRGEPSSGDIDVVGVLKNNISIDVLLEPLIKRDMLLGNLAIGPNKYHGIVRLNENHNARRFDIQLVEEESWPYALLYFTGSKQVNIEMRAKANSLGYTLNEYHLTNNKTNEHVPAKSEEDIFKFLGIPYLKPTERAVMLKPGIVSVIHNQEKPTNQPEPNGTWYRPVPSLFIYTTNGIVSTGNMACFDMDWTLVRTYQGAFPKSPSDIKLLPNRISYLNKLRNDGILLLYLPTKNQQLPIKLISITNASITLSN